MSLIPVPLTMSPSGHRGYRLEQLQCSYQNRADAQQQNRSAISKGSSFANQGVIAVLNSATCQPYRMSLANLRYSNKAKKSGQLFQYLTLAESSVRQIYSIHHLETGMRGMVVEHDMQRTGNQNGKRTGLLWKSSNASTSFLAGSWAALESCHQMLESMRLLVSKQK